MERIVGIGEYIISNNRNDIIKTYALGSCVAITIYSPLKKVLGMAHIALPFSNVDHVKSKESPAYFADTAIPFLINKFYYQFGCHREELEISIYGGAQSTFENDIFNIGPRNVEVIKNILAIKNLKCKNNDTGGSFSRTLEVDVETGKGKVLSFPLT